MIVKLLSAGKSFKGLGQYLTHDAGADTAERVAWTHTLNCANDHVPSAIHEMVNTYLDAGLLKEEAGIRKGGRPLEKPVKHLSLNWHPDETPSKDHMIEAVESYLTHMGWREGHQACLVAHSDTEHAHVHVMLNAVHCETGRKLDDGLERRRSQEWALAYEREQERIHCEQRLAPVEEREPAPTRPTWMATKKALHAQALADAARWSAEEAAQAIETPLTVGEEWAELKKQQRAQREAFFGEESREAHRKLGREVARDVREEFREEWVGYFALKATDPDHFILRDIHDGLVATQEERQKELWETRRLALREARDEEYRTLLDTQKNERGELTARQARGDDPSHDIGLQAANDSQPLVARGIGEDSALWHFRGVATEITRPPAATAEPNVDPSDSYSREGPIPSADPRVRDPADMVANVGLGMMGGAATLVERLLDGFLGGTPAPAAPANDRGSPPPERPAANPFAGAAAEARRSAEREQEEAIRDDWWDERRARARD